MNDGEVYIHDLNENSKIIILDHLPFFTKVLVLPYFGSMFINEEETHKLGRALVENYTLEKT